MEYIPVKAKEIIDEHINLITAKLPCFLEAYYIYGSISLGAFEYGSSDIDFMAVTVRKSTEEDILTLRKIHAVLQKKYRKTSLDGMYISGEELKTLNGGGIACLRFNDGVFKGIQTFERDSVDAYELLKYGIRVKGTETGNLVYTVDFAKLISKMRCNLNTYWLTWENTCRSFFSFRYFALLISPKAVEWGVLGVTRLYYTFLKSDITSKIGAGEFALRTTLPKWHRILEEAMRLRKGKHKTYYKSIFQRRKDALEYIDYMIRECNRLFEENENDIRLS